MSTDLTDDDTPTEDETPLPMSYDLPEFEGIKPVGVVTALNGSGQRITRPMHYGERGVLVVEYEVTGVGHKKTGDGMKRHHTLGVLDLYELPGKPGKSLLRSLRQAHNLADARTTGKIPALAQIADAVDSNAAGVEIVVDDEGRIHTKTVEGLLPHVDVAVLVFEDESRALWPDDFTDATGPHPEAGERIRKPGAKATDEPVLIRRVLDADTGETVEEWTDEQENERLLEEERVLAAQEQADDIAATEELLAARGDSLDESAHPKFRATALLTDTTSGTARAIGSVKADLAGIDDLAVIEAALEIEKAGKNRAGMVDALEDRAQELRATAKRVD